MLDEDFEFDVPLLLVEPGKLFEEAEEVELVLPELRLDVWVMLFVDKTTLLLVLPLLDKLGDDEYETIDEDVDDSGKEEVLDAGEDETDEEWVIAGEAAESVALAVVVKTWLFATLNSKWPLNEDEKVCWWLFGCCWQSIVGKWWVTVDWSTGWCEGCWTDWKPEVNVELPLTMVSLRQAFASQQAILQPTSVHGCEQFMAEQAGMLQAGTLQPASEQLLVLYISIAGCATPPCPPPWPLLTVLLALLVVVARDAGESNTTRDNGDEESGEFGTTRGDGGMTECASDEWLEREDEPVTEGDFTDR